MYFILMIFYFIFVLWLVWVKTPWSTKCKILVTVGVVLSLAVIFANVYYSLYYIPPGNCQDL